MYFPMEMHALKKEIKFRATRRGMREMDILFSNFVEQKLESFSQAELHELKELLEQPDGDLFAWLMGDLPTPEKFETNLFKLLKTYLETLHTHARK